MRKIRVFPISVAVCLGVLLAIGFYSADNDHLRSALPQPQALDVELPLCTRPAAGALANSVIQPASFAKLSESLFSRSSAEPIDAPSPSHKNVAPLRTIWEPGPNFSGVFVDAVNDEIIAIDNNHNAIYAYARLANGLIPPLRTIKGLTTEIDYPSAVFVDTVSNEIYTIDNEISQRITVQSRTANGDVKPLRLINVKLPTDDKRYFNDERYYGGIMLPFGLWGDPQRQELITGSQMGNNISTWDMHAGASGVPKRNIQGDKTGLADPRGISIDTVNGEIVAVNTGFLTGAQVPPSIRFFKRDDDGNVAPVRVIEGPATKLDNAPKGLYLDTVNNEVVVATSNNTMLVFPRTGSGNIAPIRELSGDVTELDHPTGVYVDTVHNEMVVSNWENFSLTVYPRTANGNVRPIRTIRASGNRKAVGLLRGRANAMDLVNDEIWHFN